MSRFSPYPEYKDSGVEWLGEVPKEWVVSKLGYFFAEPPCYGVLVPDFDADGVPMLRITDMESEHIDSTGLTTISPALSRQYARTIVQVGDVVLSLVGTIGKAFEVTQRLEGVNLSRAIARLQLKSDTLPRYLCWIFQSEAFSHFTDLVCRGTAQRVLNISDLVAFRFTFPHYKDQVALSAFLDHETSRIDALVAEQQRLIELLKEKRQAVISHAVTKGLDPDVTMKDSGVEWLGKVPAHWVVGPLRWYATIQGGVAKGKGYSDDTPTVDLPYLRVANVQDGHVDLSSVNTVTVALSEVERYRLHPGDVLMNEGGDNDKLGRGTVWEGEIADCLHQNHVFAIRPNDHLLPHWLSMFTGSKAARSYFYLYSKQSTNLASVSSSNVMSCPIPLPPREEQRQVLDFLGRETARIENLILEGEKAISFLQERRSALISAAVTGKIDVRGWQADQQSEQPEILMAAETRATYG